MEQDAQREEEILTTWRKNLESCLGICLCCPQKDKPDCDKVGGKRRGRKSLAKLRLIDGYVVNQTKITMLNAGKGKILSKET